MAKTSSLVQATDMASWSKLNYPRRLFLWLLCYSLLLMGCFVMFQYHREKDFKSEMLNARLQGINTEILSEMQHGDSVPATFPHVPNLRLTIVSPNGKVIYDNSLDTRRASNHLKRPEIAKAIRDGEGYTVRRHSESTGENYFYSATRDNNGYIVRTAVPYSLSLSELLSADMGFIWIMGGVTLIMCILGYFATRRVGLHIRRLNRFAEKAERGERIYDSAPFPNDELGSISNHIVKLYANLQQAISDRDKEHRNALHEQKEKERIKKQLTNNINHELKTPIASIQVCLEILMSHKELNEEKRQEFLERCMTNAERLKHLITDVSLITRMDDAPDSIKKEDLDLTDIISETISECEPIAEEKGIHIINGVACPLPMQGNQTMLTSVFRNLIDNAIAYSGGTRIDIRLVSDNNKKFIITVADNGSGVSSEHLPRLFERFYRIDKGRSRAAGGTGLGLSIVKNAVIIHSGTITVENQTTGGLIFTITFPVKDDDGS